MKAKRLKKKSIISKAITMCILVVALSTISIYLIKTYKKIDITESNYQTEKISRENEETVENALKNSNTVADSLEKTIKSVVGISKLKDNGSSIFSTRK